MTWKWQFSSSPEKHSKVDGMKRRELKFILFHILQINAQSQNVIPTTLSCGIKRIIVSPGKSQLLRILAPIIVKIQ